MSTAPRPPRGLGKSGKAQWNSVVQSYDLSAAERGILLQVARTADRLDAIALELEGQPLTVTDRFGQDQTHPLVVEARQSSIALARLVAALRLPDDAVDGEPGERPQRRGIRGVYSGASA